MSLYSQYRPHDWDSVIGQQMIVTILRNSLIQGRVSHAYIFTGSRGTGKTTSARILAQGVNCTNLQDGNPCHECSNCQSFAAGTMLDIIEIDAASNTGVDNMRDLIENARYKPTMGQWKVYIIDEVHMLSGGAFNALLKTLEEPPPHVKFILATTEIEKVPETIRSRALRFDFRKITEMDIIHRLQFVAKTEHITVDDEALRIIAKAARGGLRDALTLLEQNNINGDVSTEYVRSTLALVEESLIASTIEALCTKNISDTLRVMEILRERHVQVRGFFDQVLYALRDLMFTNLDSPKYYQYEFIFHVFEDAYSRIRSIPDGMLLIEITMLRCVREKLQEKTPATLPSTKEEQAQTSAKTDIPSNNNDQAQKSESITTGSIQNRQNVTTRERTESTKPLSIPKETIQTPGIFSYATLLRHIKEIRPAIVTDLKMARYEQNNTSLLLIFGKEWNYSRINTDSVKTIITSSLELCFGGEWTVQCHLDKDIHSDISDGVF